jgi:tripartite-type tricarboxylate transporter receptor subunit TctC
LQQEAFLRTIVGLLLVLGILVAEVERSTAQEWPTRPVKIVVAFLPGAAIDLAARELAQKLSEATGQTFYVENQPGASGNLGTSYVAKAAPDGYTLLFGSDIQFTIAPNLDADLPYKVADFAPVSLVTNMGFLLAATPSLAANNVRELAELAKKQSGKINYGSIGQGTIQELAMELLQQRGNFKLTEVPYRGSSQALPDLLSGQIQVMLVGIAERMAYVRSGQLKALGIVTSQRFEIAPDIPTIAEQGFPGFEVNSVAGIYVPSGTPNDIILKLQKQIALALATPELHDRFAAIGATAVGSTPEVLAAHISSESVKWARVIKDMRERGNQ